MNVVAFERKQMPGAWSEKELGTIVGALGAAGDGCAWETGTTDNGDAQLYLLGPLPDQDCELCISRIGGYYVLEDNTGRVLFEHQSLPLVARHAAYARRTARWGLVARIMLVGCMVRSVIYDRVEPLLTESEEMLVHLAPQLAAFA